MKAYYMTVQAWVPNKRDPETQTIKLTGYHTTTDGVHKEFSNKFSPCPTYRQLSERMKVSIPDRILDKPNAVKIESIEIIEDKVDKK